VDKQGQADEKDCHYAEGDDKKKQKRS